jgi:sec-independent protein translocase protein TatA
MGSFGPLHWLVVGAVVLILFGSKGKISDIMGDVAKGIKSFKKGLAEDDKPAAVPSEVPPSIDHRPGVETSKVSDRQKAG